MSKPYVRKVRDDDPKPVREGAKVGRCWLVFRSQGEPGHRSFYNFDRAVRWAIQDYRWRSV